MRRRRRELRINFNIASLLAQRQIERTTKAISRALSHLSSGQRFTSAAEDASGLAISTGLASQVRSLARSAQNINEGMSHLQTADSAVGNLMELVQRMRELAIQASNGTLSQSDRANLDLEVQQLYAEYTRLVSQTNFNGSKLLDGSFGTVSIQVGADAEDTVDIAIGDAIDALTKTIGTGTFSTPSSIAAEIPGEIKTADLNGDGNDDLVVQSNTRNSEDVGIYYGNGDGTFSDRVTLMMGATTSIEIDDFDNDGKDDILLGTSTSVLFYKNLGSENFVSAATTSLSGGVIAMTSGDINHDGHLDIIRSFGVGPTSQMEVLLGNGSGTFTASSTWLTGFSGGYASGLQLGDLNGDGDLDLIYGATAGGTTPLYIYHGDGAGNFTDSGAAITAPNGYTVQSATLSDINNDGSLDILIGARKSGSPTLLLSYLNNGAGAFSLTSSDTIGTSVTTSANGLTATDLNLDGYTDMVVFSQTDKTLTAFLGTGDGNFGPMASIGTTYTIHGGTVGDFNGDGIPDVIGFSFSSDALALFLSETTERQAHGSEIGVETQTKAQNMLGISDNTLRNLSELRATLGAQMNRLESALSVTLMTRENLAQAKSSLEDADIGYETTELVRQQILQQAQTSVLTQANFSLRAVLELLRF